MRETVERMADETRVSMLRLLQVKEKRAQELRSPLCMISLYLSAPLPPGATSMCDQKNAQWQEAGVDPDEEAGPAVRSRDHTASPHKPASAQPSAINAGDLTRPRLHTQHTHTHLNHLLSTPMLHSCACVGAYICRKLRRNPCWRLTCSPVRCLARAQRTCVYATISCMHAYTSACVRICTSSDMVTHTRHGHGSRPPHFPFCPLTTKHRRQMRSTQAGIRRVHIPSCLCPQPLS